MSWDNFFSAQRRNRLKTSGLVREFHLQPVVGEWRGVHRLRAKCTRKALDGLGEATHREVRHEALPWKTRRKELRETRNPEGLGGGCALLSSHRPYQAA